MIIGERKVQEAQIRLSLSDESSANSVLLLQQLHMTGSSSIFDTTTTTNCDACEGIFF